MAPNRTLIKQSAVTLLAVAICALAGACATLMQPATDRAFFAIDPGKPPAATTSRAPAVKTPTTTSDGAVLMVRRLRVASPYDGQAFVYKTNSNGFRTDYYNGFIAAPDQLLTGSLIAWLSQASSFRTRPANPIYKHFGGRCTMAA